MSEKQKTQSQVSPTPAKRKEIEVPSSVKEILDLVFSQMSTFDGHGNFLSLDPRVALPICVELARGDTQRAGELYADMATALGDWTDGSNLKAVLL